MAKTMRSNVEFTDATRKILDRYERVNWTLRDIVNIGIVLFDQASSDELAVARAIAYLPPGETLASAPPEEFHNRVMDILREAGVIGAKRERGPKAKSAKSG
jgi:hypothetical protein